MDIDVASSLKTVFLRYLWNYSSCTEYVVARASGNVIEQIAPREHYGVPQPQLWVAVGNELLLLLCLYSFFQAFQTALLLRWTIYLRLQGLGNQYGFFQESNRPEADAEACS